MTNNNVERILELKRKEETYRKLGHKERKELQQLIDDEVVFYDPVKERITISGGGIVSLWLRHVNGNKKWQKDTDPTVPKIKDFEKHFKLRLSCTDLDSSTLDARLYKHSLLVDKKRHTK